MRIHVTSAVAASLITFAAPAFADCKADLNAILKAQLATPHHVEMKTTAGGKTTTAAGEVIFPDSFHITAEGMEMLMVKKKAWMKMGGSWQAMPPETGAMMASMIENGITKGIDAMKNVECLGSEDYEGASYQAYTYTTSGETMGITTSANVKLYATDDGVPAWLVLEGEAMGTKSTTVQKITMDPSITISPPN